MTQLNNFTCKLKILVQEAYKAPYHFCISSFNQRWEKVWLCNQGSWTYYVTQVYLCQTCCFFCGKLCIVAISCFFWATWSNCFAIELLYFAKISNCIYFLGAIYALFLGKLFWMEPGLWEDQKNVFSNSASKNVY